MRTEEHEESVLFIAEEGARAGQVVAEVTFPTAKDGVAEINHTFVDESLRGQGVAGQLLEHAVAVIERAGKKARPTCSYAVHWFSRHPECADLLA
ncbi:MAG: N-acetyltransferase [Coriobacteriaceae bacterium]|nr:N-acetyltransferase [Coriobacteriaceae bacterium]